MKNTKQSVEFTALGILWNLVPKDLQSEVKELIALEHGKAKDPTKAIKLRQSLLPKLPKKLTDALASYGVESPSDKILVTVEMSHFLWDLAVAGLVKPESPMAKRAYERKLQDLSTAFSKEEFNIPSDAATAIRRVLDSDTLWKNFECNAYVEVKGQKRYFPIKSIGLNFYKQTIDAVLDELEENDEII